jgi:hemin uptake protein HemP
MRIIIIYIMLISPYLPSANPAKSHSLRSHASNATPSPLTWESESLLGGQKTAEILHNGNLYKLQATKLGKLILTK